MRINSLSFFTNKSKNVTCRQAICGTRDKLDRIEEDKHYSTES